MDDKYLLLIDLFNNYKDKTISSKEISLKMGYSTRSVLRYINIINSLDDNESFRIISLKNKGFKLQVIDEIKYEDFLKSILTSKVFSNDQNDILFRLVLDDISINEMESYLNYSQTSITRLMNSLNDKIINRRLSIVRKNNVYSLEGNEIQVRNFGQYLWQLSNFDVEKLPQKLKDEFIRYRDYLIVNDITDLSEVQSMLYISLLRSNNGHDISFSTILKGIVDKITTNNKVISCISCYYMEKYNIKLIEDEAIFISLMLNNDDGNGNFGENLNAVLPVVNKLLKEIDSKYGTTYEDDNELLTSVCSHISSNMISYILMSHSDNDLLNEIRLNFTNEHVYALELANSLSKMLDIVINDEDIGYLTLHFANCNEKKKQGVGIESVIVYSQSRTIANLLYLRLKDIYPQLNLSIKKVGDDISDDCLRITNESGIDPKAVVVSLFLDENDKKTIDSSIMEKTGFEPFIKLCDKSNFHVIDKVKSKYDFLNSATAQLIEKGLLLESEAKSILDRENLSSTEIAMGIAFPHGVVENKSFLSIYIFRQPVFWHSRHIRIALLMGYNKDSQGNQNAIKYLFSNLTDQNKVEKLVETTNFNDFIDILRGKKC